MSAIRRAMLITLSERYFSLFANFATIALVSRLLTPSEIGLSVIGMAIVGFVLAAREFASPNFLIQHQNLTLEEIRKAFAVMLVLTIVVTLALAAVAPWIAAAYDDARLTPYLRVVAASIMIELISVPVISLLRREMAFGKVALINISSAAAAAITTVVLALGGFSYMSFAWAWLTSAAVGAGLALYLQSDRRIFRPVFAGWRGMLSFGGYNGAGVLLHRAYESLPYLVLGRILSFDAAAYFNRGVMLCQLPDKFYLQGVVSVILPAFSAHIRDGRTLREPYLRAISLITGFQWPALVVLALLAHPMVQILFGSQWYGVVPLVQIMAIAAMFSFSFELNYPVLVAMGAVRDSFLRCLLIWPASALIITIFAFFGLKAVAYGMLVVVPFQACVSLHFIRRHIDIAWTDVAEALWRSSVVACMSAVGPALVLAFVGFNAELPFWEAMLALALAGAGWLAGLLLTRHVLVEEFSHTFRGLGLDRFTRRVKQIEPIAAG